MSLHNVRPGLQRRPGKRNPSIWRLIALLLVVILCIWYLNQI